ncbi:hypothetical protein D3C79_1031660 [compost metagenome]
MLTFSCFKGDKFFTGILDNFGQGGLIFAPANFLYWPVAAFVIRFMRFQLFIGQPTIVAPIGMAQPEIRIEIVQAVK